MGDQRMVSQPAEAGRPTATTAASRPYRRWALVAAALVAAGAASGAVLRFGGATAVEQVAGIVSASPTVVWLLPLLTLARDLLAVATIGCLGAAALFTPGDTTDRKVVSTHGYRWLRTAAVTAAPWSLVALAQLPATLADLNAQRLAASFTVNGISSLIAHTDQGRSLATVAVLAAVVAVGARLTLRVTGAALLGLVAVAATLPPVFTGHAAAAGNHQQAVSSLLLHVVGVTLWAGGLVALLLARRLATAPLSTAAHRYSRIAAAGFVVVAASGLVNAAIRVTGWEQLTTTAYGRVLLIKVVALAALAGLGLWHRRRTLPALAAGDRTPFVRWATGEVVLFAATVGLAAGLSRTPAPPVPEIDETLNTALLGFPMPGPLTAQSLLLDWYPEVLFCAAAVTAVGLYLAGVQRLRRRGVPWPWHRTTLWLAGWALVVVVTSSGVARYGPVLFSVHMVAHMALNMLVPILLVLAAPITLALRAVRPSPVEGLRGPREWLTLTLHSRALRFLSHPLIAIGLYVSGVYVLYFTGLYGAALRSHAAHLAMYLHFLAVGSLFFWLLIGPDPAPRRLPYPGRILLLFLSMAFHAIFGLAVMQGTELLAPQWYTALDRPWGPDPLADQRTGGGIAWGFTEGPSLIVLFALMAQWARSDAREARRIDRMSDRATAAGRPEDDPHEQYNAYLRRLAEAERRRAQADQPHR